MAVRVGPRNVAGVARSQSMVGEVGGLLYAARYSVDFSPTPSMPVGSREEVPWSHPYSWWLFIVFRPSERKQSGVCERAGGRALPNQSDWRESFHYGRCLYSAGPRHDLLAGLVPGRMVLWDPQTMVGVTGGAIGALTCISRSSIQFSSGNNVRVVAYLALTSERRR